MLKLQFKDRRRESVWLVDSRFTIGKANTNSLMIDDPSVDEIHAEITNQHDQLLLTKRTTKGAIKVNGLEVKESSPLKANDSILIGSIELNLIDSQSLSAAPTKQLPWSLHSNASWLEQQDYIINKKTLIGRDPACDICLSLDYLSRKHISLEPVNDKLIIEDLNSSNGTFVNGERIQKAELKPGDKIKLDVLTFEVRGPSGQPVNDPHKTIIRSIPAAQSKPKNSATEDTSGTSQTVGTGRIMGTGKPIATGITTAIGKTGKLNPEQPAKPITNTASVRAKTETPTPKEKVIARKRLAAEGKQAWISGDNQLKPKPEKRNTNRGILLTAAILLVIAAGLIYAINI